jgi:hypothetical protein
MLPPEVKRIIKEREFFGYRAPKAVQAWARAGLLEHRRRKALTRKTANVGTLPATCNEASWPGVEILSLASI